MGNEKRKNRKNLNNPEPKRRSEPFQVPPEKTGLTPEEEAYVPRTESRPLPKSVFTLLFVLLVAAFAGGGIFYYHTAILPEKQYQTATRLFDEKDYAGALALYQKVLKSRPERRDTLFQIGYCQEMLGQDTEAATNYVRHLENQPRDLGAFLRLGNIYLRQGQFEAALAPFERAVKLSPQNAEARYALGKIYERLGSQQRAIENYQQAVKSEQKDVDLLLSASKSLMNLKEYETALAGYEKVQSLASSDDKRAMHGATAARNMLGWPTDPSVIAVPGKSLGKIELGMGEAEILTLLGEPEYRETKESGETESVARENWVYAGGELVVFFSNGRVLQVQTLLTKYRTQTGLGIANFMEPKYADRFDRWVDTDTEHPGYRYILKGGGLAFYSSQENRAVIVYRGEYPPTDSDPTFWTKIASGDKE